MYLVPGHFAMLLHCIAHHCSLFSLIHCCLRFHLARVWLSCRVMCQGGVIIVYCALTPLTTDNTHLIFSVGVKHNCSWPRSQARPPLHWQATSLLLLLFTVFLHDLIQSLCVLLFTQGYYLCFSPDCAARCCRLAPSSYSLFWFLVKMTKVTTGQRCPGSLGCPPQQTRSWRRVDCTCEL